MARKAQKLVDDSKNVSLNAALQSNIRVAANRAARQAAEEIEAEDDPEEIDDGPGPSEDLDDVIGLGAVRDIFVDAPARCAKRDDIPRYTIKRSGKFLVQVPHPFSWPEVQAKYGGGHYEVIARGEKHTFIYARQKEMVEGKSKEFHVEQDVEIPQYQPPPQFSGPDPLALMSLMSQASEKAEAKAAIQANSQTAMITGIFQAMSQSQQAAAQQFQLMMLEMQKESRAQAERQNALASSASDQQSKLMMTLLTTLLTKKSDDNGFTMAGVLKMLKETEISAEQRANTMHALIDKKAEEQAAEKIELMRASDGGSAEPEDDSFLGKVLRVLPAIASATGGNAPQAQPTPEQIEQFRNQQAHRARIKEAQAVDRREKMKSAASAIPAAAPAGVPRLAPANLKTPAPVAPTNPERQKAQSAIFDVVRFDIGEALMRRTAPGPVAALCVAKLAKHGVTRQSLKETFTLNEFYALAKDNGVPPIANAWIAEFYASVTKDTPADKPGIPANTAPAPGKSVDIAPLPPKGGGITPDGSGLSRGSGDGETQTPIPRAISEASAGAISTPAGNTGLATATSLGVPTIHATVRPDGIIGSAHS